MRVSTVSYLLLSLFFLLIIPLHVIAGNEGIHVVCFGDQSLYLYKDYYALVDGVSNYDKWPELPGAVADAREVSWFLKRKGFKVSLVTDPTSQELKMSLEDLVHGAGQESDRGIVFYYAGHGETQKLQGCRKYYCRSSNLVACKLPRD